jgi:hypothetical protein
LNRALKLWIRKFFSRHAVVVLSRRTVFDDAQNGLLRSAVTVFLAIFLLNLIFYFLILKSLISCFAVVIIASVVAASVYFCIYSCRHCNFKNPLSTNMFCRQQIKKIRVF